VRVDRLEQIEKHDSRLKWIIAGAVVAATASGLITWIMG
jgi:hypothetical protein